MCQGWLVCSVAYLRPAIYMINPFVPTKGLISSFLCLLDPLPCRKPCDEWLTRERLRCPAVCSHFRRAVGSTMALSTQCSHEAEAPSASQSHCWIPDSEMPLDNKYWLLETSQTRLVWYTTISNHYKLVT